jgi:hypothetical protein
MPWLHWQGPGRRQCPGQCQTRSEPLLALALAVPAAGPAGGVAAAAAAGQSCACLETALPEPWYSIYCTPYPSSAALQLLRAPGAAAAMRLPARLAALLALARGGVLGSSAPLWVGRELCLTNAPFAAVEERLAIGARAYAPAYALQALSGSSPLSPTPGQPLLLVSLARCSAAQRELPPCNGPVLVRCQWRDACAAPVPSSRARLPRAPALCLIPARTAQLALAPTPRARLGD